MDWKNSAKKPYDWMSVSGSMKNQQFAGNGHFDNFLTFCDVKGAKTYAKVTFTGGVLS